MALYGVYTITVSQHVFLMLPCHVLVAHCDATSLSLKLSMKKTVRLGIGGLYKSLSPSVYY